jgi:hypothetical protein
MAIEKVGDSPQVKALKTTDLTPFIRMSGLMAPRLMEVFTQKLDEKQKKAIDKVMPVGGDKMIYFHLVDTPTPPILLGMAQPLKLTTMPENEIKRQQIKGIRLTTREVQLLSGGRSMGKMLRLTWRLKSQMVTILGILLGFWPFIMLGPAELGDMRKRMTVHFKPLFELMPRS